MKEFCSSTNTRNSTTTARTTVVSLEIPPNAEAGDALTFVVDDQSLELVVPNGAAPGQVLEIQIGAVGNSSSSDDCDDDSLSSFRQPQQVPHTNGEDVITRVPLYDNETTLVLHHKLPTTAKNNNNNNNNNSCTNHRDSKDNVLQHAKQQQQQAGVSNHDGTHPMVWPCAFELVKRIISPSWSYCASSSGFAKNDAACSDEQQQQQQQQQQQLSILELGSGLGLVGLAMAVAGTTLTSAAAASDDKNNKKKRIIVLSDCLQAMPLLKYNVQVNQHLIPSNTSVQTRELHWDEAAAAAYSSIVNHDDDNGNDDDDDAHDKKHEPYKSTTALSKNNDNNNDDNSTIATSDDDKFDLVVGSDLLYNVKQIPALVSTMKRHAKNRVIMAVRWRKPDLERDFFVQSSDFVDWKLLVLPHVTEDGCAPRQDDANNHCSSSSSTSRGSNNLLSWRDYGNPDCEASNQFFLQTMVAVQGTLLKPLADITEADTRVMNKDEYDAWERLQIQVYEGRVKEQQQQQQQQQLSSSLSLSAPDDKHTTSGESDDRDRKRARKGRMS